MESTAAVVSVIWVVLLRVAVGALWLRGGIEKLRPKLYRRYDQLLSEMIGGNPIRWYADFLRRYVLPRHRAAGYFFVTSEIVIGSALILGFFTAPVALIGSFFNLNFRLAAGWRVPSITPQNYLFIICQLIVVFSGAGNSLSLDALLFGSGR